MANRSEVNLLTRLDRIPLTPRVVGIIFLLSLVWLAEAFDIGIVGPVLTTLEKSWHLASWQVGLLAIASTVGIVLGMLPSGMIADKFGRRKVILFGILWFSVLTLLGALVSNVESLFAIRLLAGVGEGAVLPMPYLILSEFTGHRRRAVSVGYANGILTAAYIVPSVVSLWALHNYPADYAWRVPFLLGGIPLVMLIPIYLWLPESPRYLLERGQAGRVQKLVESLEHEASLPHDEKLHDDVIAEMLDATPHDMLNTLKALVRRPLFGRTAMVIMHLTAALILFYILQVFGPTLLATRGVAISNSILYTGIMMLLAGFGSVCQGYLSDRFGRKAILAVYVGLATIGCLLFAFAGSAPIAFAAGFLTAFFGLGIFPVSKLCVAEQYPTDVRGRGVYIVEMAARGLSGIVTTYFIPFVLKAGGDLVIFLGIAVALVVLSIPFLVFGRETARVQLEYASAIVPGKSPERKFSHK
ncbi:MFS transporter [Alicyclobacillus hesperidum]|uniref:MFS transporter n=1 Tax=Alicyclobacillus hesperidum TaxID=89784 RepID=A0AA37X3U9_9BACL|nr:MFS transporter [Alicyclobacillus hesperidum]GLV12772.1 MFS transporter [Alicyclobacillus hesperidum]